MSGLISSAAEAARLKALRTLDLLDTPPTPEFDAIVANARHLFGCKMAFVSLIDAERQWFKAHVGVDVTETAREHSFCERTIAGTDMLVTSDAATDERFASSPLVTGPPYIRFYAGIPLYVRDSGAGTTRLPVGTLCVADESPHDPEPENLEMLQKLACVLEALLEARRLSRQSLQMALERQDALDNIARTQRLLQHAERVAQVGSWRLEIASGRVHWSDQTYAIHALEPGTDRLVSTALNFYPAHDRLKIEAALERCAQHGEPWDLELDFTDAAGRPKRVRTFGEIEQRAGESVAIMGVIQDVTDRHRFERKLHKAARTDELTGIPTRRAFNEELDQALEEATAGGDPFAIAIIDLDRFKEVNDRLGHAAGDEVLQAMASKLQAVRYLGHHFVARLGGDEFILLVRGQHAGPDLSIGIKRLLCELRYAVAEEGSEILVSATIGACAYGAGRQDRAALLKCADEALYHAKAARRGTGVIAGQNDLIAVAC